MRTENQAIEEAVRRAKLRGEWRYVWDDGPEGGWVVGTDEDADEWFAGSEPEWVIDPEGGITRGRGSCR